MVTTEDKETLWQLESDEEFLNRIYESELGMNIRGETREQVLANIRRSEEYKSKHPKK